MISGIFIPTPEASKKEIESIRISNRIELPFEQLTYQWLGSWTGQHRLTFITVQKGQETKVLILKDCSEKTIGMYEFALEECKRLYGKCPSMPENVHNFCDQPGITPDTEWFEKRNKKLGIVWDDSWGSYILPARSLAPLALSYLLSTRGMVWIEKDIDESDNCVPTEIYRVKCIFMAGDNDDYAWEENSIIVKSRFERYLRAKVLDFKG